MANLQQTLRVVTLLENHPYPADPRVRPHLEALAAAGYDITVICPHSQSQVRRETINGVQIYRFYIPASGTKPNDYLFDFLYATAVIT